MTDKEAQGSQGQSSSSSSNSSSPALSAQQVVDLVKTGIAEAVGQIQAGVDTRIDRVFKEQKKVTRLLSQLNP